MNRVLGVLIAAAICVPTAAPQTANAAAHWEGSIQADGSAVPLVVDLSQGSNGAWSGTMSMPAQGAVDIPLSRIGVSGASVHFSMMDTPGSPVFEGKLSDDGKELTGSLSGGGETTAFRLARSGAAVIKLPPPSTALAPEFVGTWEGTLQAADARLDLRLKLERAPDGTGTGALITVGEQSPDLPLTTVTQNGNRLAFEIRAVSGKYSGTLDSSGKQISGEWTQGPKPLPLVFKRASH